MYERFSSDFRKAMQLANGEAQRFNHEYIGTEHALLALTKLGDGMAASLLKRLDVDVQKVRLDLENSMERGPNEVLQGKLPQTPPMKKVIEYAMEEADNLNHRCTGTQHLAARRKWLRFRPSRGIKTSYHLDNVTERVSGAIPPRIHEDVRSSECGDPRS